MKKFVILVVLLAIGYWFIKDQSSVSRLVDRLTGPLFSSKAAVESSEHKRVVAESAPVVGGDQEVAVGMIKVGMESREVRRLLGPPDAVSELDAHRQRWTYRRIGRTLLFNDHRVVTIEVR